MNTSVMEKPEGLVSDKLLKDAEAFVKGTTPDEALWLSGFFAGWARARLGSIDHTPGQIHSINTQTASEKDLHPIRVLYGTETGNSSELAETLAKQLVENGLVVNCHNMADYKHQWLQQDRFLIIITSTHGDGDPPETAKPFFEYLHSRRAPRLDHLQYAVLGLGDSSYEYFCAAAKSLEQRLNELGAMPLIDRVECDVDFEGLAYPWLEKVRGRLGGMLQAGQRPGNFVTSIMDKTGKTVPARKYGKSRPFHAEVLDSVTLTGKGSSKLTCHIELSLASSGMDYLPGDALGIVPVNAPEVVDGILDGLKLSGDELVSNKDGQRTLRECLSKEYEITTLTPGFIEAWSRWSRADELTSFLSTQGRDLLYKYMANNHIIDVICKYPVRDVDPTILLQGLRKLQPRLYSIASSSEAVPGEVHITVSKVQYELNGTRRYGVASTYLCDWNNPGVAVPVYIQRNTNFRLPNDPDVPIIMIGAGTGVAPYRAFMQHREAAGISTGPAWLFFGERNFRTDFLYQIEWQRWLKNKDLDRISLAFSREQAEKVYVQHQLLNNSREVFQWLEKGAVVYVCGDAKQMAADVHSALRHIIRTEGKFDADRAEEYLSELVNNKRYLKDVY